MSMQEPSTTTPSARVLLVMNEKGGVGKTTVAVGLASQAGTSLLGEATSVDATDHRPVLLISADPQRSAYSWSKRSEKQSGHRRYDYVQTNSVTQLQDLVEQAKTARRTVIIDSAGTISFGAETLLSAALDLCTDVLIPAVPEGLALEPTARSAMAVRDRERPFRVCLNMVDRRDPDVEEFADWVRGQGWNLCASRLHKYKMIARGPILGLTVMDLPRGGATAHARDDIAALALEISITGANNAAVIAR